MPSEGPADWYWLTLIVGTAVAAFGLGSAGTVWWFTGMPQATQYGAVLADGVAATSTGPGALAHPPLTAAPQSAAPTRLLAPALQPGAVPRSAGPHPASGAVPPAAAAANRGQTTAQKIPSGGRGVSSAAAPASGQSANAPQEAGPAPPATAQGSNFSLQLGAFLDAANAKLLSGRLASEGYAPVSIDVPERDGHVWHYVRLGAFADERAASLATRWGKDGIRCNAVAPGPVASEVFKAGADPVTLAKLTRPLLLDRLGEPEDIAATVLFLLSDEASWLTGQVIGVNGGMVVR